MAAASRSKNSADWALFMARQSRRPGPVWLRPSACLVQRVLRDAPLRALLSMRFCGLEIGLFYLLFRLNSRGARMFERVRLTPAALPVERPDLGGGVRRWSFQPYWLRVPIDDPPEPTSPLLLSSHGRSLAIGGFLPPAERLDFARALMRALARLRGGA